MSSPARRAVTLAALAFLVASAAVLGSELVLDYSVSVDGAPAGTSQAVIKDKGKGRILTITTRIKTTFMGAVIKMSSKSRVRYDSNGRATAFDIHNKKPTGNIHVTGKRSGEGWDIERTTGKKTRTIRIEDGTYDRVSLDADLWSGEVGSKAKIRVLMAGQGKVTKATVSVISRKKVQVLGREAEVTRFRIKSPAGSVEEWRLDDGIIMKSKIKTPVGKILVKLEGKAE